MNKQKGSNCSISGNTYEKKVYKILNNCFINGKRFNTQEEKELAGSSNKNDVECNFNGEKNVGIEIKSTIKAPDFMQCSIKYYKQTKKWSASSIGSCAIA